MTREQKFILNLISFTLNEKNETDFLWSDEYELLDKDEIYRLAVEHLALPYFSLLKDERFWPLTKYKEFTTSSNRLLARSIFQEYQWGEIKKAFEENAVSCIPLKGIATRKYYPDIKFRPMQDIEILYHENQNTEMHNALESIGFEFKMRSHDCDHFINGTGVYIKMHREMVPAVSKYAEYYQNIWDKATKADGYEYIYELTPEDMYIFIIINMRLHFICLTPEIKMVADVYQMKHKAGMDRKYLDRELDSIGLLKFEQCVSELADKWFADNCCITETDPVYDLSEFILGDLSYESKMIAYYE